MDGLAMELKQS